MTDISGTAARDTLAGTAGADIISGSDGSDIVHAGAGVRTLGWLKTWSSDHDATRQARKLGLEVEPLSIFTTKNKQPPALMLGFASCKPAELRRGVSILAIALRSR